MRTTTGASSTLVASSLPPSPASTTAASTPAAAELGERGGGQRLELRGPDGLGGRAHAGQRGFQVDRLAVHLDPLAPSR